MESVLCDAVSAAVACVAVTPVVAAVDRAVAESAAGRTTLAASFLSTLRAVVREPGAALRRPEMRYVGAMYGGTYLVNNLVCTWEQATATSRPTAKTAAVGAANTGLALWKDANLARLFGGGAARAVPPGALASWAVRDVVGMAVIFTLPPLLAPRLAERTALSPRASETAAQLACPLAVQPLLAPFHVLGFLLVYAPGQRARARAADVAARVPGVTALRWVRGVPPYCVGAVANTNLRFELRRAFGLPTASVVT